MKAIVAVDKNWGIGYGGKLLQRIPEDMMFFKEKTTGKVVVMGRGTFESLPKREPLKDRVNIVLSKRYENDKVTVCRSLEELFEALDRYDSDDVFVIGGGAVYAQLLPYCNGAYVTKIENTYQADTYFPNLDEKDGWEPAAEGDIHSYNGIPYRFVEYVNRDPEIYQEMNVLIRNEREEDRRAVEELTREAFWNLYVPGCNEHLLAHNLRTRPEFIPELDYVAERDGRIVGNIMYCRTTVRDDNGKDADVITFGPVSVLPEYQGRGIGSALIWHSLKRAEELGYNVVLIYGDPAYYPRYGFGPAEMYGIRTEDGRHMDALMALELCEGALNGISGRFVDGDTYHVDEAELMEFDKTFPPREKAVTKSQRRFAELVNQG